MLMTCPYAKYSIMTELLFRQYFWIASTQEIGFQGIELTWHPSFRFHLMQALEWLTYVSENTIIVSRFFPTCLSQKVFVKAVWLEI